MASRKRHGIVPLLVLLVLLLLVGAGAGVYYHATHGKVAPLPSMTVTGEQIEILRSSGTHASGPLELNDRLITHDYGADIMCSDGARLHVCPLTDLFIELDPNNHERFMVTMGAFRLETTARGLGMIIGAPFGVIHVPQGELTVLDVSVSQGAFVRAGEVMVERDQSLFKVPQNNQFTVDGLVLPLHPGDDVTLQEIVLDVPKARAGKHIGPKQLPLSLLLYPKTNTHYAPQTQPFKIPLSPQALAQNDRVQTHSVGSYILADTWGRYLLDDATELVVAGSAQSKRKHEASVALVLSQGGVNVIAPTHDATTFKTIVDAGGTMAQVTPGLLLAQAHVAKRDDGVRVKLRFGRLTLNERAIEAGSIARVFGGEVSEEPLSNNHVDVTPDITSIVHYPTAVPTINFIWSRAPTHKAMNIEITPEPGFIDVPFAESIKRGSFMVDQLTGRATYYWRVGGTEAPVQQLRLEADTPDCTSCIPPDVVSDAVPHTVIEYDETVAQVAFQWRPFEGSKYYLFRMYNDGQFETPVVAHHADNANYLLPSTHLAPGTYYWNVMAFDSEGRLLHKGAMSDFEIQQPNELPPLSIESPRDNAVVTKATFVSEGQTRRGTKLSCNGMPIATDASGRFHQSLPLRTGNNYLVYKVELNKRTQHFYVRNVTRPAP